MPSNLIKENIHSTQANIIIINNNKDIDLKRMQIVDIQILSNNKEDSKNLIANAIMFARKQGVHILELVGFGDNIRHQA